MGCDIHAYIDFDDYVTRDGKIIVSYFANNINFGRNYTLFSLMAGVRYDKRIDRDYQPLFEPRGIFERLSWQTEGDYILHINDEAYNKGWEGYCTRQDAADWIARGYSVKMGDDKISGPDWHSASWLYADELKRVKDAYERIKFYQASWFQYDPPEKQAIPENATAKKLPRRYGSGFEWYVTVGEVKTIKTPTVFDAIVAAMEALNGDNPQKSRLIFWFDN